MIGSFLAGLTIGAIGGAAVNALWGGYVVSRSAADRLEAARRIYGLDGDTAPVVQLKARKTGDDF